MTDKKFSITSNPRKLLHNLDSIQAIQEGRQKPVMVHVAPTNVCNLDCSYCCYRESINNGKELSIDKVISAIDQFRALGTKGLEFTGGGEPTLYKHLNEAAQHGHDIGYKVGLITNAINHNRFDNYKVLDFMRVSLHGINNGREKAIAKTIEKGREANPDMTISCAYVWTVGSDAVFDKLTDLSEKYQIPVRVTPDLSVATIPAQLEYIRGVMDKRGSPLVFPSDFNIKTERRDDHCYAHMIKPFVFPDGFVYVCPSIGLSPENEKNVRSPFRVCSIDDILKTYTGPATMRNHDCGYCKYSAMNELIDDAVQPMIHTEFT